MATQALAQPADPRPAGAASAQATLGGLQGQTGVYGVDPNSIARAGLGMSGNITQYTYGGQLRDGQMINPTVIGTKTFPALNKTVLAQAALGDLAAYGQAGAEQRSREDQAESMSREALTKTTGGMRETAEGLPDRMESILSAHEQQMQPNVEEIRQVSRDMRPSAEARASADVTNVEDIRLDALDAFQDTTAADIQSFRLSDRNRTEQEIDNIIAQAGQRGLDPNDPSVVSQVEMAKQRASDRLGQHVAQTSIQYNANMASLRQSYDTLLTQTRAQATSNVQRAQETGLQGLVQAEQIEGAWRQLAVQEQATAEQTRAQMLTIADQMEWQGNQWLADLMRSKSSFVLPMAPLLADIYAMQSGASGASMGNVSVTNMSSFAQSPGSYNTYPSAALPWPAQQPGVPAGPGGEQPNPAAGGQGNQDYGGGLT